MNRRRFAFLSSLGLVSNSSTVFAQRTVDPSQPTAVVHSQTTGATIDFSASDYVFNAQTIGEIGQETITLYNAYSVLNIYVFPAGALTPKSLLDTYIQDVSARSDMMEQLGFAIYQDGAWLAVAQLSGGSNTGGYLEFQPSTFEGWDTIVELWSSAENIAEAFDEVQSIDFGGSPPFLYLESTNAPNLDYRIVADGSQTEAALEPSPTPVTDPTALAYIEFVAAEYAQAQQSLEDFAARVEAYGNIPESDAEREIIRNDVVTIAESWQEYLPRASQLEIPVGLEAFAERYHQWAEALSALGLGLIELLDGALDRAELVSIARRFEREDRALATYIHAFLGTGGINQTFSLGDWFEVMASLV